MIEFPLIRQVKGPLLKRIGRDASTVLGYGNGRPL
jgi:hypothetical protein